MRAIIKVLTFVILMISVALVYADMPENSGRSPKNNYSKNPNAVTPSTKLGTGKTQQYFNSCAKLLDDCENSCKKPSKPEQSTNNVCDSKPICCSSCEGLLSSLCNQKKQALGCHSLKPGASAAAAIGKEIANLNLPSCVDVCIKDADASCAELNSESKQLKGLKPIP